MSDADLQATRLERALRAALAGIPALITQRDIADLTGDMRRQKLIQLQIEELIARLQSQSALDALGAPLGAAYASGFARTPMNAYHGQQDMFGQGTPVNVGSIDNDKLRQLVKAVTTPLGGAIDNMKTPLPYIAPKLSDLGKEKMLEVAISGVARGLTWNQMATEIEAKLPETSRLIQDQLGRGLQVEFDSGYRMQAEKYAIALARTTSVWAGNRGAIDRAIDNGNPCVFVPVSPGTCDFCVALQGHVFALSDEAADKYQVPLLASCPNGGPPFHINCRHALAPFTPRRSDAGKLPTPPDELLTRADGKKAVGHAQKAYAGIVEKDPTRYAKQIAETAARKSESPDAAAILRQGKPVADSDGNLKFTHDGSSVTIDPKTAEIVTPTALPKAARPKADLSYTLTPAQESADMIAVYGLDQQAILTQFRETMQRDGLQLGTLSESQALVVNRYTGSEYHAINRALREGAPSAPMRANARLLNAALDRIPPYVGTVSRRLEVDAPDLPAFLAAYTPGAIVTWPAFGSATSGPSRPQFGEIEFVINSISARPISTLSEHPREKEVLFQSGKSFRVLANQEVDGKRRIFLDEI